jgi:CarD family transcriptional regulator
MTSEEFQAGEHVVYPGRGVGSVTAVAEQEVAGTKVAVLVVDFPQDGLTLRIPRQKVAGSGLRRLSSAEEMEAALAVLAEPRRKASLPWMRQVRLLEEKVKSGNPKAAAEVMRDLNRDSANSAARRLYEAAFTRFVHELALVQGIAEDAARALVESRSAAAR